MTQAARQQAKRAQERRAKSAKDRTERFPKTRAAQVGRDAAYPDDDVEDDEDAGAASSPAFEGRGDGVTGHLASDLPDASSDFQHTDANDAELEDGMGANQSHEEVSKNIRDAAWQLQGEQDLVQGERQINGKLVKPAPKASATRSAGVIKQFSAKRKSTYDLDRSSETSSRPAKRRADATVFSPLRAQKKAPKVQEPSKPSPRRSGRVRAKQDEAARNVGSQNIRTSSGATQNEMLYRDHFRDTLVQKYAQEEAGTALGDGFDGNIDVADHEAHAPPSDEQDTNFTGKPPKPKQGRSPNVPKIDHVAAVAKRADSPTALVATNQTPQRRTSQSVTPSTARSKRQFIKRAAQNQQSDAQNHDKTMRGKASSAGDAGTDQFPKMPSRRSQRQKDPNEGRNMMVAASGEDAIQQDEPAEQASRELADSEFDGAQAEDEEPENGPPQPSAQQKQKQKASSNTTKANTSVKRGENQRREEKEDEQEDDEDERDDRWEANRRRLWGQWITLRTIHRNLGHVGCNTKDGERLEQNEIDLTDEDVKALVKLCKEAKKRYRQLKERKADEDSDPSSVLQELCQRIDGLRGRNREYPTKFDDMEKTTQIYFHLIPALVGLVLRAVECYEILDQDESPTGQMSMSHLQTIRDLIKLTLDMEYSAAKDYKARPKTSYAVVKPIHEGIAVPLRAVRDVFTRVLQHHEAQLRFNKRQQDNAEHDALVLEQEERRNRQAAELTRVRQKWEQLHRERMACEGGFIRPAKSAHLRMPEPDLDEDFDGHAYRRISIFQPRVGPPPGLVDRAAQLVWTEGELRALEDGLRKYTGRMVFERLFREWCGRGKMLNKYNVTEIVTTAAMMREVLIKEAEERGEEVEAWVRGIPLWTKGHAGMGKENIEGPWVGDAGNEADGEGVAGAAASAS